MIKGFIEVHNIDNNKLPELINTQHIVDVRGSIIYLDDALPTALDYSYTKCVEDYYEIKDKIKEATR